MDLDLQLACMNGNIDAAISLLQNGADPTVSHNAAIRLASQKGHANIVSLLLQDGRVDPTDWKNFAIYVSSYNGHVDVVDVLLQDGRVDPTDENEEAIRAALTKKIREMLMDYKYRVDGKEYCKLKSALPSLNR